MPDARAEQLRPSHAAAQRPMLVVFSHLRWDFVFQRPQHLLTRAAASFEVLFWEEVVWTEGGTPRIELSSRPGGITVATPHVPRGLTAERTDAAQRQLLDQALAERQAQSRHLVAWFYTPMALTFAAHLQPDATVYDCMDELSAFRGAPARMLDLETLLLSRADLVFAGGRSLYEAKRGRHADLHCFPSSIDVGHFGQARVAQADPADQIGIARPRLGFFGVIDERMDIRLVDALARLRPDWQFVMIGPVVKIDPAAMPQHANVHWLGPKGYAELPGYLAGWDIGIMPFALNESTRFISPTKTPEFLAAGLPLVSTSVVDVVRDWGDVGLVEIAADAEAMVAHAEALMARPRAEWLQRVDARLAGNSWDATWVAMRMLLEQKLEPSLSHGSPRQAP
ncbi:glycosyltransferase family 1 protein [Dankookia sp. GCM10030260]|uniref:glycosyltransferase family 1 protein n=1 Tax=Dankookia sp. GCM10030260 TaxID=3273390 RepID=UPI0036105EE2